MNIVEIQPQQDFTLLIRSSNGQEGIFDVCPYLGLDAFRPLEKLDNFLDVHNGKYFVEWSCGADLSADTIFSKWQVLEKADQPYSPRDAQK